MDWSENGVTGAYQGLQKLQKLQVDPRSDAVRDGEPGDQLQHSAVIRDRLFFLDVPSCRTAAPTYPVEPQPSNV